MLFVIYLAWMSPTYCNSRQNVFDAYHAPNEIFEKFEKSNLRPLPDEPFNFDGADIFDFKSGKKVGRNDPCPCGSGKKYKKCCLGKDERS
jgi:uncharacterized protein YchJ